MNDDNVLYVGVAGYFQQPFDEIEAREILESAFDDIEEEYIESEEYSDICVVSGLSNMGIPKIAYEIAEERGYTTWAVVPDEVFELDVELYDVDEIITVGEKFGDESEHFIEIIDVFVKIGGGEQSQRELELAEEQDISVYEYDLESYEVDESFEE